jgi:sugar/nucleoside kinase (ribokinase family)
MASNPPIIVVAGHACVDLIPELPAAMNTAPNTLTRIGPAALSTGGAVANVGLALHRLGLSPRLVALVGDDAFGSLLREYLASFDERLARSIVTRAGSVTSYSIVVAPAGQDRSFWHCPGANDDFTPSDVPDDALAGATWFHFGYPPNMRQVMHDADGFATLLDRARRAASATSLDFCSIDASSEAGRVDWRAWLARVLPSVDLFAPSYDEMSGIFGAAAQPTAGSVRSMAEAMLAMGARAVALKLGEAGLYYRDARVEHYVPCFECDFVGATGAGDSTIAGLIAGLASGASLQRSLTLAAAAGAASCERPDATSGIPSVDALRSRMRAGWRRSKSLLFTNPMEIEP